MSEMVERVARAIAGSLEVSADSWRDHVDEARAAILAMREPTEGMCEAGREVNNLSEESGHFEFLSRDEMAEAWQTMIDEALK